MKTTVEIDEPKLKRVMRLTGLKTKKAAIDFALTQAERMASTERFFRDPFFVVDGDVIDPAYDLARLREKEKPVGGDSG